MQSNQTPTLVPLAWAANGTKNTIPEASQITITPGAASLNDGFPPICAIKVAVGGIAPAYGDFNGIFNLITQSIRWAHAGGRYAWNSTFANDTNVGGYPNGATLMRADLTGFWINTADNNATNPDATDGSAANWVPGYNYGVTPITGLTNTNVTLTPAQAAKSKITLAGSLTGNIQLIFPAWTKEWEVVNNTTGAFTITAKTSAGTGIPLAAGQQKITGDGTNITQPAESIAAATLSQHAVQLGQVAGVVGSVRDLVMSVTAASASATLTADEIIVETALGGLRYCLSSFGKTINLATTGAGGMDTGSAPTSGFVAIYAIYNPNAALSSMNPTLLATNATSAQQPNVYGGANMPTGYIASALLTVYPTDSSGHFKVGVALDRWVHFAFFQVLLGGSATTAASFSLAGAVPMNAKEWRGNIGCAPGVESNGFHVGADANFTGYFTVVSPVANKSTNAPMSNMPIITSQTAYYACDTSGSSASASVNGYRI